MIAEHPAAAANRLWTVAKLTGVSNRYSNNRTTSRNELYWTTAERDNVRDVDEAFAHLVESGILRDVQKQPVTAARGQVVDAIYRLFPTAKFVGEMKAANKRIKDSSR